MGGWGRNEVRSGLRTLIYKGIKDPGSPSNLPAWGHAELWLGDHISTQRWQWEPCVSIHRLHPQPLSAVAPHHLEPLPVLQLLNPHSRAPAAPQLPGCIVLPLHGLRPRLCASAPFCSDFSWPPSWCFSFPAYCLKLLPLHLLPTKMMSSCSLWLH